MLGVMRAALLMRPFKQLTRNLQQSKEPPSLPKPDMEQKRRAEQIGKAVSRAAAHTPWQSACLVQSLAVRKMLQRRRIPGLFYLGVSKEDGMKAHAWSQCDGMILTGMQGHEKFTVVSVFSWGER
jgi:hypothetical protein